MRRLQGLWAAGLAVGLGAVCAVAVARDLAGAEALFREGKALLDRGQVDAACEKLAASQQLDPSSGTLLNLARCHERQGKTATAWAEFLAAARMAETQGKPDRVVEAKKRAAALEPTLSYVVVTVAKPVAGLTIERNGSALDPRTLGSRIPVDPGPHEIVASAPGFQTAKLEITIGKGPEVRNLAIPELHEAPKPAPAIVAPSAPPVVAPSAPPVVAPSASSPAVEKARAAPAATSSAAAAPDRRAPPTANHTAAYVLGGIGGAALVVGGTFGVLAMSAYSNAKDECPTKTGCSGAAMTDHDSAVTRARIADIGIGVGVAGLAAATVLYFTAGRREGGTARATVAPYSARTEAGLSLTGAF
jgi:hypothetical protein